MQVHFACGVVLIFWEVLQNPEYMSLPRDLDVVELWSGVGSIWTAAGKRGLAAKPFDKNRAPLETALSEDILSAAPSQRHLSVVLLFPWWWSPLGCTSRHLSPPIVRPFWVHFGVEVCHEVETGRLAVGGGGVLQLCVRQQLKHQTHCQ